MDCVIQLRYRMARKSLQRRITPTVKSARETVAVRQAPSWLHPAVLAAAAFTLLAWFTTSFRANDAWWHLEMGQYLLQHHRMPWPDPFNFATYLGGPAYPAEPSVRYFNLTHEWLAEVFFYPVYLTAGFGGVVLFRALILMTACAASGLMVWRRTSRFYASVLSGIAPAAVLYLGATDRPHLFTYLFVALFLVILDAGGPLWLLPVLSIVWANCHGGFVLGWVLVGAFCAAALYCRLRGKPPAGERQLWFWGVASILVSLLNPNGLGVITTILQYHRSQMLSVIAEWRPTVLWPPGGFVVLLVAGALVLLWTRGRARPVDLMLFALFGVAGVYAVRNIFLIGLFAPVVIATYLPWKSRPLPAAVEFAIAALIVGAGLARIAAGGAFQFYVFDVVRPAGAAEFLLQHRITGRIYNNLEHGGYLMWRLWPNNQMFVDGRLLNETVYRDYRLLTYGIDAGKPPLQILDDYAIPTIVTTGFEYASGEPHMLMALLATPGQTVWKLVYKDATAAVFMRQPPPGVQPLNNLEAFGAMQEQCSEHLRAVPSEPGCARGMAKLFQHLNDPADARRWLGLYLERKVAPDPEAERQYQMMLSAGR
jgi:hypothetical protein